MPDGIVLVQMGRDQDLEAVLPVDAGYNVRHAMVPQATDVILVCLTILCNCYYL